MTPPLRLRSYPFPHVRFPPLPPPYQRSRSVPPRWLEISPNGERPENPPFGQPSFTPFAGQRRRDGIAFHGYCRTTGGASGNPAPLSFSVSLLLVEKSYFL